MDVLTIVVVITLILVLAIIGVLIWLIITRSDNSTITGPLTVSSSVNVGGDLAIQGSTTITKDLVVKGTGTFDGAIMSKHYSIRCLASPVLISSTNDFEANPALEFDPVFDTNKSNWDTSRSDQSKLLVPRTANYLVFAQVNWGPSPAVGERGIAVFVGGVMIVADMVPAATDAIQTVMTPIQISQNSSNYIQLRVMQTSGGPLAIGGSTTPQSTLELYSLDVLDFLH